MAVLKTRWKSASTVEKPKEEKKIPEKKIIIPVVEEQQESITPTVVEDPTAEEFIATLPKKQSRKRVTKIIEE